MVLDRIKQFVGKVFSFKFLVWGLVAFFTLKIADKHPNSLKDIYLYFLAFTLVVLGFRETRKLIHDAADLIRAYKGK